MLGSSELVETLCAALVAFILYRTLCPGETQCPVENKLQWVNFVPPETKGSGDQS